MIELKLRIAPIKPDKILRNISEKFGFEPGIPEHIFDVEKKFQRTAMPVFYRGGNYKALASLKISEFNDIPAYYYEYHGPVLKKEKFRPDGIYRAYALYRVGGCFSCGGMRSEMQVIRDEYTPEWFPVED